MLEHQDGKASRLPARGPARARDVEQLERECPVVGTLSQKAIDERHHAFVYERVAAIADTCASIATVGASSHPGAALRRLALRSCLRRLTFFAGWAFEPGPFGLTILTGAGLMATGAILGLTSFGLRPMDTVAEP